MARFRPRKACVFPPSSGNGATGTLLHHTRPKGWTADHVVVAAEGLTAKGAYVASSRGRKSCILHTPDKARLMERLPEGNRRAALDVLSEIRTANAPILNRVGAWKQLAADLAQRKLLDWINDTPVGHKLRVFESAKARVFRLKTSMLLFHQCTGHSP